MFSSNVEVNHVRRSSCSRKFPAMSGVIFLMIFFEASVAVNPVVLGSQGFEFTHLFIQCPLTMIA